MDTIATLCHSRHASLLTSITMAVLWTVFATAHVVGYLHSGDWSYLLFCAAETLAALALGHAVGLPFDAMLSSLRTFAGLEHRCQWVRDLDGVSYYNDSKATNVGAALAAIEGLGADIDGKLLLIAGGDGKGADFKDLKGPVAAHCRAVVLMGRDSDLIAAALGDAVPQVRATSLDDAIAQCRALAQPGDAVLLSPACASFDMFKNYEERGQLFARAVEGLA